MKNHHVSNHQGQATSGHVSTPRFRLVWEAEEKLQGRPCSVGDFRSPGQFQVESGSAGAEEDLQDGAP